jgi:hypothetical protein
VALRFTLHSAMLSGSSDFPNYPFLL